MCDRADYGGEGCNTSCNVHVCEVGGGRDEEGRLKRLIVVGTRVVPYEARAAAAQGQGGGGDSLASAFVNTYTHNTRV